jgi:hypothetical protein
MQRIPVCQSKNGWRDLYVAALFEGDRDKLAERIADAEKALVHRARELFQTPGDHIEEEHAMDDAMYALHALRNTISAQSSGER